MNSKIYIFFVYTDFRPKAKIIFTHHFQNAITKLIWDSHARGVLSRKKQLDDLIVISCQVKLKRGKVILSLLEETKTEDPGVQNSKQYSK
jgi:hypothetical protein